MGNNPRMASLSHEVERLLSVAPKRLPLSRDALRPEVNACDLRSQHTPVLFPGARHSEAALAGLLLRLGCWAESHGISQDIASSEGSYWHGIVHRMEPDSSNAKYWFRQTGQHPIFSNLQSRAAAILHNCGPRHWGLKAAWDPFLFIDWCDEAREHGGEAETAATEIQLAEWQLLFDWCVAAD